MFGTLYLPDFAPAESPMAWRRHRAAASGPWSRPGWRPFWDAIPPHQRCPGCHAAAPSDGAASALHLQADRCSACAPPEGAPPMTDQTTSAASSSCARSPARAARGGSQCITRTCHPRGQWRPRVGRQRQRVCRFPARLGPMFLATATRRDRRRCRRRSPVAPPSFATTSHGILLAEAIVDRYPAPSRCASAPPHRGRCLCHCAWCAPSAGVRRS